jgi:hypothetical protein
MNPSSTWIRRAIVWGAAGALTIAMVVAGSAAQAAHSSLGAGPRQSHPAASPAGVGYPRPQGIYAPFTACPLLNPLMQESTPGNATGCVAGDVLTGEIKIGTITTKIKATAKVKYPVAVQFGIWDPPNAGSNQFTGGILPPPAGPSRELVSVGQLVRGGLLKALGCPSSNRTVQRLCTEATSRGGKYLKVYAAAQSAGPITNFQLTTWTQPVEFHLMNPLLGANCYIGSSDNPVVLNPTLTGTLVQETDPHPKKHPDTAVLKISGAIATDTTFTAPGVTGCGPGGSANIAIDEAVDTSVGLPTATGADSITLDGTFYLAACYAPHNMASILLSAFKASARTGGGTASSKQISAASLHDGQFGIRPRR